MYVGKCTDKENLFFDNGRKRRQDSDIEAPIFFEDLEFTEEQQRVCQGNRECLFDFAVTGIADVGISTLNHQKAENVTNDLLSEYRATVIYTL